MGWVILRVGGTILSAFSGASLLAVDAWGIYPDKSLSVYAFIAFVVFVIFVGWGWGRTEMQLRGIKRIEKHLEQLADLREEGVNLRNRGWERISIGEENNWWRKVEQWKFKVIESMNRIHPADGKIWATLGNVERRTFSGIGINRGEMQRRLSMLTQWFERLESYINERTKR